MTYEIACTVCQIFLKNGMIEKAICKLDDIQCYIIDASRSQHLASPLKLYRNLSSLLGVIYRIEGLP